MWLALLRLVISHVLTTAPADLAHLLFKSPGDPWCFNPNGRRLRLGADGLTPNFKLVIEWCTQAIIALELYDMLLPPWRKFSDSVRVVSPCHILDVGIVLFLLI